MAFLPFFTMKATLKLTKDTMKAILKLTKMEGGTKIINRTPYRYSSSSSLLSFRLLLSLQPPFKLLYMQQVCPSRARWQRCAQILLCACLLIVVCDNASEIFIYSDVHVNMFGAPHLKDMGWYLHCQVGFTPPREEALFSSL